MNVLSKTGPKMGNKYRFIDWDESYMLGIPLIDSQNKNFVEVINKLYVACNTDTEDVKQDFIKAANEAITYVRYHFWTEEKLMLLTEFSGHPSHKKEHESFVIKIMDFIDWFVQGKQLNSEEFISFLKKWILSHIENMDRAFADFILQVTTHDN